MGWVDRYVGSGKLFLFATLYVARGQLIAAADAYFLVDFALSGRTNEWDYVDAYVFISSKCL